MKAAVYRTYGSPDNISVVDVDKPAPEPDHVLIRVRATTVNRTDCAALRGTPRLGRVVYGVRGPKNPILGNEFAGEVASVGTAVTEFKPGDNVIGYNDHTYGGHAEYVTMPESGMMATMPRNVTFAEAAPSTEGAHYALTDIRKANVQPRQKALVIGASGAIGSASVQLLKHFGAEVTAVASTKHIDLVRSLGADLTIDYTREDFTDPSEQYDFVHDAVGKSSFGTCKGLLKPGGSYRSSELEFLAQNPFLALLTSRFGSRNVIFPIPRSSKEDAQLLTKLIEAGTFRPIIDRQYSLNDIAEAYRYVERGHKTGNVVIIV